MITNTTPYLGKLKLKFEKHPEYTNGRSFYNKTHLDLGFTKLVSRIFPYKDKEYGGWKIDMGKVLLIETFTEGEIFDWSNIDDTILIHNSFMNKDRKYIGDIRKGWQYYNNKWIVCDEYPKNVAIKLKDYEFGFDPNEGRLGDNIECYVGLNHRAIAEFRIGDKLFDESYEPNMDDFEEWEYAGYEVKLEEAIAKVGNSKSGLFYIDSLKNGGLKYFIPFNKRGKKLIENWEEAKQAALNFSKHNN
jgi:hypothetical protein